MKTVQKILFITIFQEGDGGGEGRVAYEMARWFSEHYQVVMLCPGNVTGLSTDSTGFKRFQVQSMRQGNLAMPLLSALNVRKVFKYLDDFRPEVIHIHDPALLGVVGQLWARLNRVPVFYTAHVLPSRALDFGASEITKFLNTPGNDAIAEKYLLNFYDNCDAVVGLNQNAASEVRRFGYNGEIFIIPNGRSLRVYNGNRFADPAAPVKNLTFVGFLNKRKNQAFLLDVMKVLPKNYHLQLIGEPLVPAYLEELKKNARENQLNVTFMGQLSQKEIAAVLENTHVFVSASKMEVQSLVIIEALASGTPVVGLSNETVDELVDETDGIWLPKDANAEEFAWAVHQVCNLPAEEYFRLCKGARSRVNTLDWSNVMKKTVECYNQVVTKNPRTTGALDSRILMKYISQITDRRVQANVLEIVSYLTKPAQPVPDVNLKAVWMAWLNMTASVVGYYALKGPLIINRRLDVEKHRILKKPIFQAIKPRER